METRWLYIIAVVLLQGIEFGDTQLELDQKFACQGGKLRIRCKSSKIIRVYEAEYGRKSLDGSICNSDKIIKKICKSHEDTLKIAEQRCNNKARCNLKADSSIFPDPCPDNYKYLEVIFACVERPPHMTTRPPSTRKRRRKTTTPIWTTTPETTTSQPTTTTITTTTTPYTPNTTHYNTSHNITTTTATIITKRPIPVKTSRQLVIITTNPLSTTTSKPPAPAASGYVNQGEAATIMNTVVSFFLTYIILSGQPKYVLVLFLSGVAIATVLLLVLLLGLHLRGRRSKKFDVPPTDKPLSPHPDDDDDDEHDDDDEDDGVHDGDDDDSDEEHKNVTIEIQGGNEEAKHISVKPGDIIIIDSKDLENDDSEDLGYMSEIIRYHNSRNLVHDDGCKQSLTCETPSVNSIPNSESDKREMQYETVHPVNGVCAI